MTPMVFAATDFGLSFILEWVALAIIVVIVVRKFPIPQLGRMMSARMEAIHTQLVASEKRHALRCYSMGGFDVRLYASLYRTEVAGMVLVDSSHPEQQNRLPPALNDMDARPGYESRSFLNSPCPSESRVSWDSAETMPPSAPSM